MGYSDFTCHKAETQKIINAHKNDFTANNVKSFLKSKGGYKAYIRSLGGVFAKYIDFTGQVSTKKELEEICDYVWGLYDIWGVDYSNGCKWTWSENKYKAYAGGESRFYPNESPTARFNCNYASPGFANGSDLPGVDEMLSNPDKYYAVVNCGQGVAQTLKKAGIISRDMPDPAYYPERYVAKGLTYKLIKNAKDLQPGDIILITQGGYIPNRSTRTTLTNWTPKIAHTFIIADKDSKYIWTYDSGHAYTYYGECRSFRKIGDNKVYEWQTDWIGIRLDIIANLPDKQNVKWVKNGDVWNCYIDNILAKGWKKIYWKDGLYWFYFKNDGAMATGWQKITYKEKDCWFYFKSTGVMVTDWQQITYNGKKEWFYFDSNGIMISDCLKNIKNNFYYFDQNGVMQKGVKNLVVKVDDSGKLIG